MWASTPGVAARALAVWVYLDLGARGADLLRARDGAGYPATHGAGRGPSEPDPSFGESLTFDIATIVYLDDTEPEERAPRSAGGFVPTGVPVAVVKAGSITSISKEM